MSACKRKALNTTDNPDSISIEELTNHYESKFDVNKCESERIKKASNIVSTKCKMLSNKLYDLPFFNRDFVIKYIKTMNSNSAPGPDGVTVNHLETEF